MKLASHFKAFLRDIKTGNKASISRSELIKLTLVEGVNELAHTDTEAPLSYIASKLVPTIHNETQAPVLSVVVAEFLKRYDGKASANAGKWFVRYLESIGLRDDTEVARLLGFHAFRHTFITRGMENKIPGIFEITGHETESVDGFGKISSVARGYWTGVITDNIREKQTTIENFDFDLEFYRPTL